jgi:hypothetical protein
MAWLVVRKQGPLARNRLSLVSLSHWLVIPGALAMALVVLTHVTEHAPKRMHRSEHLFSLYDDLRRRKTFLAYLQHRILHVRSIDPNLCPMSLTQGKDVGS